MGTMAKRSGPPVWNQSAEEVIRRLESDAELGIGSAEAQSRLRSHGPNRLEASERESAWQILLRQFRNIIMLILAIASGLSFAFEHTLDGVAIVVAMAINATIGFVTELQSVRSLESLSSMESRMTTVVRDGERRRIDAEKLVPGDLCVLDEGDVAPADMRLVRAQSLAVDESSLTGESVSVDKDPRELSGDTPLAERTNMVYKGTGIQEGDGIGVVVATGMDTEVGTIARLASEAEGGTDPLTTQLDDLASLLVRAIIVVALVVGAIGVVSGKAIMVMLETTVALIVAAVPEGLPVVATLALARGMYHMAGRNALVRRLAAVQTLGSTTVILTDKTGTLTENRMEVRRYRFPTLDESNRDVAPNDEHPLLNEAVTIGALCTEGDTTEQTSEPMEQALLKAAEAKGDSKARLFKRFPREREIPFDPDLAMMASIHCGSILDAREMPRASAPRTVSGSSNARRFVAVKGSPEAVVARVTTVALSDGEGPVSDEIRERILAENKSLAADGMRVLALATRDLGTGNPGEAEDGEEIATVFQDLHFVALVGLEDPPREEAAPTIRTFRRAGIKTVMATGDQEETARAIGRRIGLLRDDSTVLRGTDLDDVEGAEKRRRVLEADAVVRLSPEEKLTLISLHQEAGDIVAMTGDGVNDAPALRKADIGVAMGERGEAVAKEAADLVLTDDSFSTIATAVEYGRVIFNNIRRFTIYLTSGNVAEILIVAVATVLGAPVPLLPLQILYLNAINDVFPALALGVGRGEAGVMEKPPRDPGEGVLELRHSLAVAAWGALIAACVLGAFFWVLGRTDDTATAVSVSFLSIGLARLWHVINMRSKRSRIWRNQVVANPYVWSAIVLCVALFSLAAFWPPLSSILGVASLGTEEWVIIAMAGVAPAILGQIAIGLARLGSRQR